MKITIPFIGRSINSGKTEIVTDNYKVYLNELLPKIKAIKGAVRLEIAFYYYAEIHPDLDNLLKPLIDSLKGKILVDDRQVLELNTRFVLNTGKPKKIELKIEKLK